MTIEIIKNELTKKNESIELYIEHHLEEISKEDWEKIFGKVPNQDEFIDLLELQSSYEYEGFVFYDYSLPNNLTDYVICIKTDKNNKLIEISMES